MGVNSEVVGFAGSGEVPESARGGAEAGAVVVWAVLLASCTEAVVGRALAGSGVKVTGVATVVGNNPSTGGTAPGGSKMP
jgi:hypothetical protein